MASTENKKKADKAKSGSADKVVKVAKTPADLQRIRLEKLMKKPEKPVYIPDKPDEKVPRVFKPPEFIRNIWGSSAGAGSGDFHVYRGVRRREYARQKHSKEQAERDEKDVDYHKKVEENKQQAEQRTAKKRAKRQKKKQKQKGKKVKVTEDKAQKSEDSGSSEDEEEENEK